jgi:predicted nucleic acid-binding protein
MNVIIDTSVWSLALRRSRPTLSAEQEIARIVRQGRVQMLGIIRQELLSGIRSQERFEALCDELAQYNDLPVESDDHERAAAAYNTCRSHGVQSNVVDMLICALAIRHGMSIYTANRDFQSYARYLAIDLYQPTTG